MSEARTPQEIIRRAEEALDALCSGKQRWTMTVPPDDRDPDLRFADLIELATRQAEDAVAVQARLDEAVVLLREYVALPAAAPAPLDVERLARALHRLSDREAIGVVVEGTNVRQCEWTDHIGHANAIAAAYAAAYAAARRDAYAKAVR